jgi:transposase
MSRSFGSETLLPMKKSAQHLIAEVPRRQPGVETTIGIDLGDVGSHYCTLNEEGEVLDRGGGCFTSRALLSCFRYAFPVEP